MIFKIQYAGSPKMKYFVSVQYCENNTKYWCLSLRVSSKKVSAIILLLLDFLKC